jgi:hypothetical protein
MSNKRLFTPVPIPAERCGEALSKLRHYDKLPGVTCQTDRFAKPFVHFSLNSYQLVDLALIS